MTTVDRRPALRLVLMCLAPIAAAALAASFVWDVEAMASGAPWRLLGIAPAQCPGCAACGLSRAFAAWSHLRLGDAVGFNPGVVALYPAAWFVALTGTWSAGRALVSNRRN